MDSDPEKVILAIPTPKCTLGEFLYDGICRSWERVGGAMFETDTEFTIVPGVSSSLVKSEATLHTGVWNTRYRPKLLPIRQSNAWYFCDRNTSECVNEDNSGIQNKNRKTYTDLYVG